MSNQKKETDKGIDRVLLGGHPRTVAEAKQLWKARRKAIALLYKCRGIDKLELMTAENDLYLAYRREVKRLTSDLK
jgi:hypothetical protein